MHGDEVLEGNTHVQVAVSKVSEVEPDDTQVSLFPFGHLALVPDHHKMLRTPWEAQDSCQLVSVEPFSGR